MPSELQTYLTQHQAVIKERRPAFKKHAVTTINGVTVSRHTRQVLLEQRLPDEDSWLEIKAIIETT